MLWEPTRPPTTHHLPGCLWEVPRVFGSSTGVLGSSRDVRADLTRGSGCHVDQSGDTRQFLPRGMPHRLQFDVDQCHVSYVPRGSPVHSRRTFPGCCGNPPTQHPPTTHHLPGCFWEVPRVFGSSTGVLGNSRDVRGSSGCFWEVPRVFLEVPGVFGKFPGRFGNSPRRHGCFALPKAKLSISGRCSMLNLREFEVPHLDHESDRIESFEI